MIPISHGKEWQAVKSFSEAIPFWQFLGLKVAELQSGYARLLLPVRPEYANMRGNLHGGLISSLIDMGGAAAVRSLVLMSRPFITVELKLNYLEPAPLAATVIEGRVVRSGKTIAVTNVEVKDGDGQVIAVGLATYMILGQ